MPGFDLLTIFNYFIVVPVSGELPFTYSWNLKLKSVSSIFWVKITSNISKKAKDANDCLEVECNDQNLNFINDKDMNPRYHLRQDRQHLSRKGQFIKGNKFSTFMYNFYFWKLTPQHQQVCMKIVCLIVGIQLKLGKR